MPIKTLLLILSLWMFITVESTWIPNGKSWLSTDRFTAEGRNKGNQMNFFCRDCCLETIPYLNKTLWSASPEPLAYHLGEPSVADGRVYSTNRDGRIRSFDLNTGSVNFAFNYSDYVGSPLTPGEWSAASGYGLTSSTGWSRSTPLLVYPLFSSSPDKAIVLTTGIGINKFSVFDPNYNGNDAPPLHCQLQLTNDSAVQFAASAKWTSKNGRRIAIVASSSRGEFYLLSQQIQPTSKGSVWAIDIDDCEVLWHQLTVPDRPDYAGGSIVAACNIDDLNSAVICSTQNNYIAKQTVLDCLSAGNPDCSHLDEPDNFPDSLISWDLLTGTRLGAYSNSGPSTPDINNLACNIDGLEFLCAPYNGDDGGPIMQPMSVWNRYFDEENRIRLEKAIAVGYKRGDLAIVKSPNMELIANVNIGPGSDDGGGPAFNGGYVLTKNHGVYSVSNPDQVPYTTIHNVTTTKSILVLFDFNTNTVIDQQPVDFRPFAGCPVLNDRFAVCTNRDTATESTVVIFDIYDNFKIVGRAGTGTAGTPAIIVNDKIIVGKGYVFAESYNTNGDLEVFTFDYDSMPAGLSCH